MNQIAEAIKLEKDIYDIIVKWSEPMNRESHTVLYGRIKGRFREYKSEISTDRVLEDAIKLLEQAEEYGRTGWGSDAYEYLAKALPILKRVLSERQAPHS